MPSFEYIESAVVFGLDNKTNLRSFKHAEKDFSKHNDAYKFVLKYFDKYSEFPDSDTTDGVKITIDKKNWIMVRPSGTEPIIRIYAESDSEKNLDDLISKHIEKIKSILAR